MYYDLVLAFDMDDTLCNTQSEVYKRTLKYCFDNLLMEEYGFLIEHPEMPFSDYQGKLKKIMIENIIEKREYMDTPDPTKLMVKLISELKGLRKYFSGQVKFVICTHRGNNISAWLSTYNYLKRHGIQDDFDMIHSIDFEINKDKLKYLERMYPNSEIILVDDNPFGSKSEVREFDSRILIYNEIANYKCHKNQATYLLDFSLFDLIDNKVNVF